MNRRWAMIAFFTGLVMFAAGYFVRDLFESSSSPPPKCVLDLTMPVVGAAESPAAADPLTVRVRIALDGQLSLESGEPTPRGLGRVAGVEDGEKRTAIDALKAELLKATSAPATREADGTSKFRLEVVFDGGVPWVALQWTMQVAADPAIKIRRLRFAPTDASLACEVTLPTDVGAGTPLYKLPPSITATVTLEKEKDATVSSPRVRIAGRSHVLPSIAGTEEAAKDAEGAASLDEPFRALDAQLVDIHAGSPNLGGEVAVPEGGLIASRVVVRLIRSFQSAGITTIRFGGAAFPKAASTPPR